MLMAYSWLKASAAITADAEVRSMTTTQWDDLQRLRRRRKAAGPSKITTGGGAENGEPLHMVEIPVTLLPS
jgi:hypothetical protein